MYLRTKVNVTGSPEKTKDKSRRMLFEKTIRVHLSKSPQIVDFWSKAKFVVAVVWKQRDKVVAGGSCKKSGAEDLSNWKEK